MFDKLQKKSPTFKERIKVVEGNLEKDGLDLSPESAQYLQDNVNIILHIAATVKFDEEIIKALGINLRGTREVLEVGRKAKNLEVSLRCTATCLFKVCHTATSSILAEFYLRFNGILQQLHGTHRRASLSTRHQSRENSSQPGG